MLLILKRVKTKTVKFICFCSYGYRGYQLANQLLLLPLNNVKYLTEPGGLRESENQRRFQQYF